MYLNRRHTGTSGADLILLFGGYSVDLEAPGSFINSVDVERLTFPWHLLGGFHFSIVWLLSGGYSVDLEALWAVHVFEPKTCPGTSGADLIYYCFANKRAVFGRLRTSWKLYKVS